MAETLPALTVRHPWALGIALGIKPVENRTRALGRNLVGQRLAIHASKGLDRGTFDLLVELIDSGLWRRATVDGEPLGVMDTARAALDECWRTRGHVVAVGTLDRVIEHGDGDPENTGAWRGDDRFGLVFRDVVRLSHPVPATGRLGIWRLYPRDDVAVRAQLARGGAR